MTRTQKLMLRQSEVRQKIGEMLDTETEKRGETFDDDLAKLTREMRSIETEIQAAIVAEPEPETRMDTPEGRELRGIIERASLGVIVDSVIEHRSTDGAEAEIQKHYGLTPNQVPLALLETRAVTPAPSNVQGNQQPIIPYVFPQSVAAFLGVDMPTVSVGEAIFPVLTSTLDVGTPAENAAQAETTGAFSAEKLSPARLQASFFFSREDRARFAMMEESLRQNLSDGLADGLDKQVLAGTNGLLNGTVLANHNVNAETGYADYRANFLAERVDGRYAATMEDLRIVFGADTYAHADSVWRGTNTNNDVSALDVLMQRSAGVRVSAHVPDAVSNKQNGLIRLGMNRDYVAPVWNGVDIIYDEVTKADNGQIKLTAVMLYATKLLRADGFYKQQTQHA